MKILNTLLAAIASTSIASLAVAEPVVRTANDGNLVMEDVPEIPAEIVDSLNRFQNVRSASFREWTADSKSMYISTRFGMSTR